jgi:predicted unusual protein kinase regulating ubiquinone biosynthesis (AarF/ABC1/UbiB family)
LVPDEFVSMFSSLCFRAPPMHFALLREIVEDELGGDPHDVFATFNESAFAAASLGQVHRARLRSGEEVAVKIQYPGVARTVSADLKSLLRFLMPLRLGRDWQSLREQWDAVRRLIERETDYEEEARFQEAARSLFQPSDGIVVPRVFAAHSTRHVLTTEYLEGRHLEAYFAGKPSQEERDRFGTKILRASVVSSAISLSRAWSVLNSLRPSNRRASIA